MSVLYTLTIRKKQLHCTEAGCVERWIEQVMHGVPGACVATWRRSFPANIVSVIEESDEVERSTRSRVEYRERRSDTSPAPAASLDYGTLINSEIGS